MPIWDSETLPSRLGDLPRTSTGCSGAAARQALLRPAWDHAAPRCVRPGARGFGANMREDASLRFGFQVAEAREATAAFGHDLLDHACEIRLAEHGRCWA